MKLQFWGAAETVTGSIFSTSATRDLCSAMLRDSAAILRDPQVIERADVLLTESTYGGRQHGPMNDARDKLAQVVGETPKTRSGSTI